MTTSHPRLVAVAIGACVVTLAVSLVASAVASWAHLSHAYGAIETAGETLVPRIAATAVELGLLALTLAGALLAALSHKHVRVVYAGVALFSTVSFLANVYAAARALLPTGVTASSLTRMTWLDWGLVVIGSGTLPVMVILLTHAIMAVSTAGRAWWQSVTAGATIAPAPVTRPVTPTVTGDVTPLRATAASVIRNNPRVRASELARVMGVTPRTAYRHAEAAGYVRRGGAWAVES